MLLFLSKEAREKIIETLKKERSWAEHVRFLWRSPLAWHCWKPMVRVRTYQVTEGTLNSGCPVHRPGKKPRKVGVDMFFCSCPKCSHYLHNICDD
jgi:hypothetical protein